MVRKIEIILLKIIMARVLVFFISPQISKASCCFPCVCELPDDVRYYEYCPNSGLGCNFTVTTRHCYNTGCISYMTCMTTIPTCYLGVKVADDYEPEPEPGGSTCYRVIGGDHCSQQGNRTKITIWWSWVSEIGTEDACIDLRNCFFCDPPPVQPSFPECGYAFKNCPFG